MAAASVRAASIPRSSPVAGISKGVRRLIPQPEQAVSSSSSGSSSGSSSTLSPTFVSKGKASSSGQRPAPAPRLRPPPENLRDVQAFFKGERDESFIKMQKSNTTQESPLTNGHQHGQNCLLIQQNSTTTLSPSPPPFQDHLSHLSISERADVLFQRGSPVPMRRAGNMALAGSSNSCGLSVVSCADLASPLLIKPDLASKKVLKFQKLVKTMRTIQRGREALKKKQEEAKQGLLGIERGEVNIFAENGTGSEAALVAGSGEHDNALDDFNEDDDWDAPHPDDLQEFGAIKLSQVAQLFSDKEVFNDSELLSRNHPINRAAWRDFLKEVHFCVVGEVCGGDVGGVGDDVARVSTADSASFYVLFVSLTKMRKSAHYLPEYEECLGFLVGELARRLKRKRERCGTGVDYFLLGEEGGGAKTSRGIEITEGDESSFGDNSTLGSAVSVTNNNDTSSSLSTSNSIDTNNTFLEAQTSDPDPALKLKHLCGICGTFSKLSDRFVSLELRENMHSILQQTTEDVCSLMQLRRNLQESGNYEELSLLPKPSGKDISYLVDATKVLGLYSEEFQKSLSDVLKNDWDVVWGEQALGMFTTGFIDRGDGLAWRCLLYRLKELVPSFSASTVVNCVKHMASLRIFEKEFEEICRQRLLQRCGDLTSSEIWGLFCETDLLVGCSRSSGGLGVDVSSGERLVNSLLRRIPDVRFEQDPLPVLWKIISLPYELDNQLCKAACQSLLRGMVRRKQHRTRDAKFVMARLPGSWRGVWQLSEGLEGGGGRNNKYRRMIGESGRKMIGKGEDGRLLIGDGSNSNSTKNALTTHSHSQLMTNHLQESVSSNPIEEFQLFLRSQEEAMASNTATQEIQMRSMIETLKHAEKRYGVGMRGSLIGAGVVSPKDVLRLGRILFVQDLARKFSNDSVQPSQLMGEMGYLFGPRRGGVDSHGDSYEIDARTSSLLEIFLLMKNIGRWEKMHMQKIEENENRTPTSSRRRKSHRADRFSPTSSSPTLIDENREFFYRIRALDLLILNISSPWTLHLCISRMANGSSPVSSLETLPLRLLKKLSISSSATLQNKKNEDKGTLRSVFTNEVASVVDTMVKKTRGGVTAWRDLRIVPNVHVVPIVLDRGERGRGLSSSSRM